MAPARRRRLGTGASRLRPRDGASVDAVESDGATCWRHAASIRDRVWLRAGRKVGLSLRAYRGARRWIAGVWLVYVVAAGVWGGDVRDGDADIFGSVGTDQSGV